jgi:hypothetical protein
VFSPRSISLAPLNRGRSRSTNQTETNDLD